MYILHTYCIVCTYVCTLNCDNSSSSNATTHLVACRPTRSLSAEPSLLAGEVAMLSAAAGCLVWYFSSMALRSCLLLSRIASSSSESGSISSTLCTVRHKHHHVHVTCRCSTVTSVHILCICRTLYTHVICTVYSIEYTQYGSCFA